MFDWLGFQKGLPLWWSYRLNRGLKKDVEDIFEGIASTRKELLIDWANEYWGHLDRLLALLQGSAASETPLWRQPEPEQWEGHCTSMRQRAPDFSEIFLLNEQNEVVFSTYPAHRTTVYGEQSVIGLGLSYAGSGVEGRKCLFGPYSDPTTLKIGPSTSSFHDAMTLLFIVPIVESGVWRGALCGRVPNDVIGDLIQRESGHVYPDSGDNYLFMASAGLQTHIAPGTALSRSRFEDRTFTHGENLKDGVTTDWGQVTVKEHTELELRFTDPATGDLHPGVANTIKNGSNLFVEFPGYSDYRHIPVIGKGVTFRLPHCPDLWGMMCEGDLEEVYRVRGTNWRMFRLQLPWIVSGCVAAAGLIGWLAASADVPFWLAGAAAGLLQLAIGLVTAWVIYGKGSAPLARHLHQIQRFIRMNAEGKGDLTQRLKPEMFQGDESRELAKWINNMIDSLEGVMLQVKRAAADVLSSQRLLNESTDTTAESTDRMSGKINDMIGSLRKQLRDIDQAKDAVEEMKETLRVIEANASGQIAVAQNEVERIGDKMAHISAKVEETNRTISTFMETTQQIKNVLQVIEEISSRTNLLALNAAIEAARVGEHGKGFAVVATEIRKLADLTRRSTEEIHETVQHIYTNAEQAFISMGEGTKVVEEGSLLVAAASELLNSASSNDSLKTQVIDEVVKLMERIAEISKDNRVISREVEGNVQELITDTVQVKLTSKRVEAITAFLEHLVNQFRLNDTRIR
ncbi:methyl-accepting chemotaxis protein [Paenibacillus validus]|uniref:methyl-accepting chemotaxis protein n=1 Tax=Paenibacillus TaxID=44249 RepID=UPI000FDBE40E|nr:methyl-accepting chemotaxis protein [Paenibacillus validus]MED4603704.1 methyl-accepting chemotaxis protein [Paenibacillus validus]MED4609413.1 methyl-accepting chemotaxis protein [Paenibacillus validus]